VTLDGHYSDVSDEAYTLIREALTTSVDIRPGPGELPILLARVSPPGHRRAPSRAQTT
jgi:hypothetical protein